jgi:TolB-like protein
MRFPLPVLLISAALLLAGCAGTPAPAPVTPEELSSLEAEQARSARDPDVLTRIGIRFYQGKAYQRAVDVLAAALQLRPAFNTAVYLGLSQEALGQFGPAERSYRQAGAGQVTRSQQEELNRRIASLSRARLLAEARQAIARESTFTSLPPMPNTVAVLPWSYVGTDPAMAPLGYGLAHLVVTDLSGISRLTLIERERIQAMLDEMTLVDGGRVSPATAARAGRLLRASLVLHGIVRQTADGIRLEATVVRTEDGSVQASGGAGDRTERLFALEKSVVLDLVSQMGIQLSPAEQRSLSERPTQDLQAFLAFSRGLEAESRGDFRGASGLFSAAAGRDPAFGAARRLLDLNTRLAEASGSTPASLARVASPLAVADPLARGEVLRSSVQVIVPSTGGDVDRRTRLPVANPRLPEALGQDNPSRLAIIGDILILIPRP